MKKVLTKRNGLIAGIASIIIIIAVVASTTISDALTLNEAKDMARKAVPSTASFKTSDEGDNEYEVTFYDQTNKETFVVEVSKKTEKVKKVETQLDNNLGSKSVKLSKSQVEKIVRNEFPGIKSLNVTLNKDDGLYEYEATFKASTFYGDATVNPETGAILESEIKYGTATVIPQDNTSMLTYKEAKAAVIKAADGGTISDIELDEEKDVYYYDVELIKGNKEYDYKVNASNGKVTLEKSHDKQIDSNTDSSATETDANSGATSDADSNTSGSSQISKAKARDIVLAKIPGATIKYISLDKDDGRYTYDGKAVKGDYEYEFEIDASSGVIVEWDKERIDTHDNDNDHEEDDHEEDD